VRYQNIFFRQKNHIIFIYFLKVVRVPSQGLEAGARAAAEGAGALPAAAAAGASEL
jgi:hypothetical protein